MALNKFTDSSFRKEWMKINCDDLKCATLTADTFNVDDLQAKKIIIEGEVLPQLLVESLAPAQTAEIKIKSSQQSQLAMLNSLDVAVGIIKSNDVLNEFTIDPQTREKITIRGSFDMFKIVAPSIPDSTKLTLYAKTLEDNLYILTSASNDKLISTYAQGQESLNIALQAGGVNFNQPIASRWSVNGKHVAIWGVFRLDSTAKQVDVRIDPVPGYPVLADSQNSMLSGQKFGAGAVSYIGVDFTFAALKFDMFFGSCNDATVTPANNLNTLFHYRIDYFADI